MKVQFKTAQYGGNRNSSKAFFFLLFFPKSALTNISAWIENFNY